MKLFLSKLLIVLTSIGILLATLEMLNRKYDRSSTYFQKKFILNNRSNIQGLIFGSSYMWLNIQPQYLDSNVASLALAGSAPNIDYSIFSYAKQILKPKFILLDASKSYLINTQGNYFIESGKLSYYFPTIKPDEFADLFLTEIPINQYFPLKSPLKYDQWGCQIEISSEDDIFKALNYKDSLIAIHPTSKDTFMKLKRTIRANNTRSNLELLRKIIRECITEEIKVIFVSPPKYHLFNQFISEQQLNDRETFMSEVVDNQHVFFLNYDKFNERSPELFFNVNHMNNEGSIKFSKEMNSTLKAILIEEF